MPGNIYVSSGGGGKAFAYIGVICSAGASLTCTKGSKVLRAVAVTDSWVFAVPEAGFWEVAVVGGLSKTVEISSKNQFKTVALRELVIYNGGDVPDITGGWGHKEEAYNGFWLAAVHDPSFFEVGETLSYYAGRSWNSGATDTAPNYGWVYTLKAIDVTFFNTIIVESEREGASLWVGSDNTSAGVEASCTLKIGTNVLDISAISGARYITFYNNASYYSGPSVVVPKIVLSGEEATPE